MARRVWVEVARVAPPVVVRFSNYRHRRSLAALGLRQVLYRFQGGNDGAYPRGSLIADQAGNLYGTTSEGGDGNCIAQQSVGCGTVFELVRPSTPGGAWTESVLYSFQGVPSGQRRRRPRRAERSRVRPGWKSLRPGLQRRTLSHRRNGNVLLWRRLRVGEAVGAR